MSRVTEAKRIARSTIPCMLLALVFGCGDAGTTPVYSGPGTGGSGGSAGSSGTGGMGTGGISGTGGAAGTGGISGTGGVAGTGGTGGTGAECVTNALCPICPAEGEICSKDDDCESSGYVCVPSGCETHQGAAIKRCQPSKGPSCADVSECPNSIDYACIPILVSATHCVRVTPGCSPSTETIDCAPGFSCEGPDGQETCVDRRLPCNDFTDCPRSYVCHRFTSEPLVKFCVGIYRTCRLDPDCGGFGGPCADVDGNGTTECTGVLGAGPCVNLTCTDPSAPVCEADNTGTTATCGNHGLCRPGIDDCGPGFECTGLSQDDRTECVPTGGTCQATPCPVQQVCAAPHNGVDPPSCQSGSGP